MPPGAGVALRGCCWVLGTGYGLWPAGPAAAGGQRNQLRRKGHHAGNRLAAGNGDVWRPRVWANLEADYRLALARLQTSVTLFSRFARRADSLVLSDGSRREFAAGRRTWRPSPCGVSWLRIRSGFEPIVKNEVKGHPLRFSGRQRFAGGMFIRVCHANSPSAATCRPAVCRNSRLPVSERLSGARFPRSPDRASHWIWSACHWMAYRSS